jgi:hypothetical protein
MVPQRDYELAVTYSRNLMAKAIAADPELKKSMLRAHPKSVGGDIEAKDWALDHPLVRAAGRKFMKTAYAVMQKAGVSTALGYNFYDLRGPAYFIFPLLTPFIQMIGKAGKVNAGVGTVAHWKATRNPNSTFVYGGVVEGQRNATATPDENDYFATYKELGQEGGETFTAQWAGEGYTDNLADEHFRNLARVRLTEEMMTLGGNSGTATGNLGFALGQAPNVTSTVVTGTGPLGNGANVTVAVVGITWMGYNPGGQAGYAAPPSVAGGLTTNYIRTNADGSTTNITAGISQISNAAANVTTNATAQVINVTTTQMPGAVAYAWFWGVNTTAALGNVKLGAITAWPHYQINGVASGTYAGNAAGLSVDNSFNPLDFDGLFTYTKNNGTLNDMNGGSFTSAGNGQVAEVESDLNRLWTLYQAQPNAIWCSADVRQALEQAVVYSTTGTNSVVFVYDKNGQKSGLTGGFVVTEYKSKYAINPEGGEAIPIRIHPMFPPGTMIYDINTNPYPHSRIPAVRQFLLQRDYYAIEWPVTTRQWTFGTYIHEVLAHYVPWITAARTGIGPFVAPCWIAAAVFGEDFFTGLRVNLCRRWLVEKYEPRSVSSRLVMGLYRKYGQAAAKLVEKSGLLKKIASKLFNRVLANAEREFGSDGKITV